MPRPAVKCFWNVAGVPMLVTVNLAKGALTMSRKKVIVKRLQAIQNFGAMDVLCTDKTGTLTTGNVVLTRSTDAAERAVHYLGLATIGARNF